MKYVAAAAVLTLAASAATAEPVTYELDPSHTYPSFEADHMGLSIWRGKFNKSSGKVVLDKAAETGRVDVTIDMASVDFGHDEMNEHAVKADILDVDQYPTAVYQGKLVDFEDGAPSAIDGELTLHGVTKPLTLQIERFRCTMHPMLKKEVCGADARGTFQRDEFGIDAAKEYGFDMGVELRIQVEGVKAE